jgi:D-alanyl-lipoteichoic acid acyltransferase DltB (MBOAT superfamily)
LILATGAVLAAVRAGGIALPVSTAIWPIFGAMFMFRLIVYLYDLANNAAPFSATRAFAYFFMLPNVCFPLFPVVDYKSFCRTYYDQDEIAIYQTGVQWMFRGLLHLLLYRWVYQNLLVGADTVTTSLGAAMFVLTAYLMYLKISGSFHMIVGMLHLFGFNLGPTNNKYFLSESFTDYWRRINIYWKDFLQKVFFNPVYFRLNKKMNGTAALICATLIAFFVTWALHSYQWFWIRGSFPVIWQDIVFWSIMGLLVLGNMLYENKYGRQRTLKKVKYSFAAELRLALRTIGTFVVVCFSWVIWSSETFAEFTLVLRQLLAGSALDWSVMVLALAALGVVAVVVARSERGKSGSKLAKAKKPPAFWLPAYQVSVACVAIMFIAYAPLVMPINPKISNVVDNLKTSRLNARDMAMMDRGYYEDLTNVARFNEGLGNLYAQKPPNWERCWAMHPRDGCPDFELMANKEVWFKGATMTTNQWAMRDRPYDKEKPANTWRAAVTGASHDMGTGVGDDEVYDNVVEDRVNAESEGVRYEFLNFSVGGYGPVQRLVDIDARMFEFQLDALIYVGIDDLYWMIKDLADAAQENLPIPYDHLNDVLREEGITPGTAYAESMQKLKPRNEELLRWLYDEIVARCRQHDVVPMAAFIPHMLSLEAEPEKQAQVQRQMEIAREAGMIVLDLTHAYDGQDYRSLWIAPWDSHPNTEGHRLLAEALYKELKQVNTL